MNLGQQFLESIVQMLFGPPRVVGATLELVVDAELVNPPKQKDGKIYQFSNCPENIIAAKLENSWISVRLLSSKKERTSWIRTPVVKFLTGRFSGVIYEIVIDVVAIKRRGLYFFTGCDEPDWPHYFTSVILAHLEMLKFTQKIPSGSPVLVTKIIRNYGPQIFEEML